MLEAPPAMATGTSLVSLAAKCSAGMGAVDNPVRVTVRLPVTGRFNTLVSESRNVGWLSIDANKSCATGAIGSMPVTCAARAHHQQLGERAMRAATAQEGPAHRGAPRFCC